MLLFLATCASTFWVGCTGWLQVLAEGRAVWPFAVEHWRQGLAYMAAVMGILVAHEMGHFLMAVRYHVPASFPHFIPLPIAPFGTMGAVIGMRGFQADRRQMFDLGLAGPLAGLAVAVPVLWVGAGQLRLVPLVDPGPVFHHPLLLQLMLKLLRPDLPADALVQLPIGQFNPLLMAGWVGLLVTGLNMLPLGQLDGGHVTYALLGRRAHLLARTLLIGVIFFILIAEEYMWVLMVVLVTLLGTDHPPTADDRVPLGWPRRLLGWASLWIPVLCFSPLGISM